MNNSLEIIKSEYMLGSIDSYSVLDKIKNTLSSETKFVVHPEISKYIIWLSSLDEVFQELSTNWKKETSYLSSPDQIVNNENYLRIIGMGKFVIPSILTDLKNTHSLWFPALRAITGENPVLYKHRGDSDAMTKDWLKWGIDNGYDIP